MAVTPDLDKTVDQLASSLLARQWRLCTVESCTGGWVAQVLTDIAGSSGWFECGWVTYSNDAKMRDVGVKSATLSESGAVSEAVALEMAFGAVAVSAGHVSLAITGVAGPTGGSVEKPVGTVCFGWVIDGEGISETVQFDGDRRQIREQSVHYVLDRLLSHINKLG